MKIRSCAWRRTVEYWSKSPDNCEIYVDDLGEEIDFIGKWYEARFAEMDEYFGIDAGIAYASVKDESAHGKFYLKALLRGTTFAS